MNKVVRTTLVLIPIVFVAVVVESLCSKYVQQQDQYAEDSILIARENFFKRLDKQAFDNDREPEPAATQPITATEEYRPALLSIMELAGRNIDESTECFGTGPCDTVEQVRTKIKAMGWQESDGQIYRLELFGKPLFGWTKGRPAIQILGTVRETPFSVAGTISKAMD